MKQNGRFRAMYVDLTDGWYTAVIQYHSYFIWPHWITIKTMESNDREYLDNCIEEILDALNMDV